MSYEVLRDLVKVLLALLMIAALWWIAYHYRVTDAERADIRRKANSKANGAWSAVCESDREMYEKELKKLRFQIAARDAVIEDQSKRMARMKAVIKAYSTGKGGRIQ